MHQKGHVPWPLLGRDQLWFDSLKRPLNPCILGSGWLLQGVSKVRSDFLLAKISLIIKKTFCKTWYVIHYSFNIE